MTTNEPQVCTHCGGVDTHYEDCKFSTINNDKEVIYVDEHGNKYIGITPTDNGLKSMQQLFIGSREDWKEQLSKLPMPRASKMKVIEMVGHIEALTDSIATTNEYFRIKELLQKQGIKI